MNKSSLHKTFLVMGIFLFSVFIVGLGSGVVQAQSYSSFSVALSPEIPGPYQNVTATLTSYSIDLDRTPVSWSLNGKTALSGIGKKTFSFTTGGIGVTSKLSIVVSDIEGTKSQTLSVIPGEVDLLWQASDVYVPAFYRGKALPAPQSKIKAVAMPNIKVGGSNIKASSLVYKWTENYKAAPESSGYGKNVFSFTNSYLNPEESVQVAVNQVSGTAQAEGKILIKTLPPIILFYENNPLQGIIFEKALGNSFSLSNNEMKVDAEPYFFSSSDKESNLSYSWQLNGNPIQGSPDDTSSLVIRNENNSGTSQISLSVNRDSKIMQSASNNFSVNFGR